MSVDPACPMTGSAIFPEDIEHECSKIFVRRLPGVAPQERSRVLCGASQLLTNFTDQ